MPLKKGLIPPNENTIHKDTNVSHRWAKKAILQIHRLILNVLVMGTPKMHSPHAFPFPFENPSFFLFRATSEAHGSSQARGQIRAAAEAYATATATLDLSRICDPRSSLWQYRTLNPLSEARECTCILAETVLGP